MSEQYPDPAGHAWAASDSSEPEWPDQPGATGPAPSQQPPWQGPPAPAPGNAWQGPIYPGVPSGPLTGPGYPWVASGPQAGMSLPPDRYMPGQPPGATSYPPYPGYGPQGGPLPYPGMPMPGAAFPPGPYPQMPYPTGAPPMPPRFTGAPPMPLPPGQYPTGMPTYAGFPAQSQTLPGDPMALPVPYSPYFPLETLPQEPVESALARPFTVGTSVLLFVGALALSLGAAAVTIAAAHADWSAGATACGITALILAGVSVVVALLRVAIGRRATVMYALSAAMVVVLAVGGLGSMAVADPLHGIQAQTLERNGQWADAIREYGYAGQAAPNAPDVARVYDEWGEQLLGQRSYGLAVSRFDTVVTQYVQSGTAVDRGRSDLYNAYRQWVSIGSADVPYAAAITFFESYVNTSRCDASCQSDVHDIEVQARFLYGTQLAASSNFADAIAQFEAIQSQFPQSTYAPKAHAAAAQAYYAEGQAFIASNACPSALTPYQTLAAKYGDTPEGQKAKAALSAGVDVTGAIPNPPKGQTPPVFLSKHIDVSTFFFSSEYKTTLGTNGSFTFHGVKPGDYNIASSVDKGTYIDFVYWHDASNNLYFIHVGQLCPVQVSDLQGYP